jgi:hypothetical protein
MKERMRGIASLTQATLQLIHSPILSPYGGDHWENRWAKMEVCGTSLPSPFPFVSAQERKKKRRRRRSTIMRLL